jgi:hypothetical protein
MKEKEILTKALVEATESDLFEFLKILGIDRRLFDSSLKVKKR